METKNETPEEGVLEDALRNAGWLLAHQAGVAAQGEAPMPIVCLARVGLASPQLIAPRTDSDSYDRQVAAGKILLAEQGARCRFWAYAYDEDLGPSGRVLFVEVGVGGSDTVITFAQRYRPGFRLVGDLHPVGEELLPPDVQARLEACRWRYLVTEGATHHDQVGEQWLGWSAARDAGAVSLQFDRFRFAVPEDWCFRQTQSGDGWLMMKLVPWDDRQNEPSIMTLLLSYPAPMTSEAAMQLKRADLLKRGLEVSKATVSELPSLSVEVASLAWNGGSEGRRFRTEWSWVPAAEAGSFLVLVASTFNSASWESLSRALDGVLASLERVEVSTEKPAATGDFGSWLGRLLGRRKR
jgi:hypothetical protein